MYFVVYDEDDNIVAYLDSLDELISFFNFKAPKKIHKHRWKNRDKAQINYYGVDYYVYKFF